MSSSARKSLLSFLPVELRQEILDYIPDLWSITSFRLACREFNDYIHQHKLNPQRHIIEQLTHWYTFLTKRHLRPGSLDIPAKGQQWTLTQDVTKHKSKYTLDVMRSIPYFRVDDQMMTAVCPDQGNVDWREDPDPEGVAHHMQEMSMMFEGLAIADLTTNNLRDGFALTLGRGLWLNVMHARVYQPGERASCALSWPLDEFVRLQCQHIKALSIVYEPDRGWTREPGHGTRFVRLEPWKQSGQLAAERLELETLCSRYGWPDELDQHGLQPIQDWFDAHYISYLEIVSDSENADFEWFDRYMTGQTGTRT